MYYIPGYFGILRMAQSESASLHSQKHLWANKYISWLNWSNNNQFYFAVRMIDWMLESKQCRTGDLANRQLLAVFHNWLNIYGRQAFTVAGPQSGTLSQILSGTWPSVQTVSYVCLKRVCLLDTSAFSALEVLDDNRAI